MFVKGWMGVPTFLPVLPCSFLPSPVGGEQGWLLPHTIPAAEPSLAVLRGTRRRQHNDAASAVYSSAATICRLRNKAAAGL